jgi:polyvinyl alcohol dehydrogenase (cytochrome)
MRMRTVLALAVSLTAPALGYAQAPPGPMTTFQDRCATCHTVAPPAGSRVPSFDALRNLSPEAIFIALTTGPMAPNATDLTESQKRALAEYLGGRPIGAGETAQASAMQNRCRPDAFADIAKMPAWNGWGADIENSRFQSTERAGLTQGDVPKLKLKWAFAFPNATSVYAQPAIVGGRLFVGSANSFVYALNAKTGCVYWSFRAGNAVRTAVSVGPITEQPGARYAIYFGDLTGAVYAVNAETGSLIWKQQADPHPLARITGSPTLHRGRLYVPVAGYEEAVAANPKYECCTTQGAVVAYDANTGARIWRASTITEPLARKGKTSAGTQLWGPSGASVWSAPTIDERANILYVATGDAFTAPAAPTTDAIVAFDLDTGRMRWSKQLTPDDAYLVGCGGPRSSETCPTPLGPDFDFGASPILRRLPNGRRVLTAGQKSGVAWGLDPDKEGAVIWEHRIGKGSVVGGIEWGGAADDQIVYYPNSDSRLGPSEAGGLAAIRLATGERLWMTKPPPCQSAGSPGANPASSGPAPGTGGPGRGALGGCSPGQSAAATVIPGVVFSGSMDGVMRAFDARDGRIIWEFDTRRPFSTINGVDGKGGGINGPGPVVAGGIVYVNSGYGSVGGIPGNVLLAFAAD